MSTWEINDIIVAAHRVAGKDLPKVTDMKKEADIAAKRNLQKYEKAKEAFSQRKADL